MHSAVSEFDDALIERDSKRAITLLDEHAEVILAAFTHAYALHRAVEACLPDLVDRLLALGVNPNEEWEIYLPLSSSIVSYDGDTTIRIIESLIRYGADPNALDGHGEAALHVAVDRDLLDVSEYLVEHGADVDVRTRHGETPLHVAARQCCIQICKYLLMHGADGTARDVNGYTVMSMASYGGSGVEQIAGILLRHGVPLDVFSAVCFRQIDVVRGFLADRPDEIRADPLWKHLLVAAVDVKSPGMVRLLLSAGADPNAVGFGERSPLETAFDSTSDSPEIVEIVEMLRKPDNPDPS